MATAATTAATAGAHSGVSGATSDRPTGSHLIRITHIGPSTANLKSLATQLSRWEHLLHTSEGCIPRETLDVGTHGARERPLRAVILVAAHRMGLRRRMRGWRRPKGAGGGGDVGVGVGGDPGGCSGGGGLGGNELGGGGGGEGEGGEGGRGGDGGNCRRPGLAWKGVCWAG